MGLFGMESWKRLSPPSVYVEQSTPVHAKLWKWCSSFFLAGREQLVYSAQKFQVSDFQDIPLTTWCLMKTRPHLEEVPNYLWKLCLFILKVASLCGSHFGPSAWIIYSQAGNSLAQYFSLPHRLWSEFLQSALISSDQHWTELSSSDQSFRFQWNSLI